MGVASFRFYGTFDKTNHFFDAVVKSGQFVIPQNIPSQVNEHFKEMSCIVRFSRCYFTS